VIRPDKNSSEYRGNIFVTPLGIVDEIAVRVVAANIQMFYDLAADVESSIPYPETARIPARNQYNAGHLLSCLMQGLQKNEKRIGVASHDISLPFLTHLFGEAQVGGKTAVISTFRLKPAAIGRSSKRPLLYDRLAKVAVHETGHLLGLLHCQNAGCIMSFSMGLDHLDLLDLSLCSCCTRLLNQTVLPEPS